MSLFLWADIMRLLPINKTVSYKKFKLSSEAFILESYWLLAGIAISNCVYNLVSRAYSYD